MAQKFEELVTRSAKKVNNSRTAASNVGKLDRS
jgi:hypothetical protein